MQHYRQKTKAIKKFHFGNMFAAGMNLEELVEQFWGPICEKLNNRRSEELVDLMSLTVTDECLKSIRVEQNAEKAAIQCFITTLMRLKAEGWERNDIADYLDRMHHMFWEMSLNFQRKYKLCREIRKQDLGEAERKKRKREKRKAKKIKQKNQKKAAQWENDDVDIDIVDVDIVNVRK